MNVIRSITAFRKARRGLSGTLGLVPTMGFLHEGHLELVRRAKADNDTVAVSIFVNPTQFGPDEDFEDYPRDIDKDLALLKREGVTLVFNPTPQDMYPRGYAASVDTGNISVPLEGTHRSGHFKGVATVVAKLFNIVEPDRAYFGQKDGQQIMVIKQMATDLDFNLEVVVVPTVRESDGLAMSSRNTYLSKPERLAATCIFSALFKAKELWDTGTRKAGVLRRQVIDVIEKEPLAHIDYVSVADAELLQELSGTIHGPVLISTAVRIGKTRLIDNIVLRTNVPGGDP